MADGQKNVAPFPSVVKRLDRWLICGRCGVPVGASIGSLSDSEKSPLVGLAFDERKGEPVLMHNSCLMPQTSDVVPLTVDMHGGNSYLFGYALDDLKAERLSPIAADHRTVATYCSPTCFIVSLHAKSRITTAAVVGHVFKEFAEPSVYSWLSIYTAPDEETEKTARQQKHNLLLYTTAAFNKPGAEDPVTVFVHYYHFPRSEPHRRVVPPLPPVRGLDLVYQRGSIEVHESGREVSVGAYRLVPAKTHAFLVFQKDQPPLLFVRKAVEMEKGKRPENSGAVVPLVSVETRHDVNLLGAKDLSRLAYIHDSLGYEMVRPL